MTISYERPPPAPRPVLYVNHEVECGGAEHSLLELIAGLDRTKYAPHLACSMEGPLTDRARELGAEIHLVPMLFSGKIRKFFGLVQAAWRLRRLIRDLGIRIVHTNSLIAGYCGIFAAKLCEVPSVWHVRDISYPPAAKKICTQADRIVANSRATAESLEFPERLQSRLHVIYNGVRGAFFSASSRHEDARRSIRAELNVTPDENLVGIFARLDPWKGHADLLDASKIVCHRIASTSVVVVGATLFDGSRRRHEDYKTKLEEQARALGIFGKVHFLGHRQDIPQLMAAMDVIVQPSAEPEPFGRSIAEAQAVGVPTIGSGLGGIPELIEDRVTGLLFPAGDYQALADCVISLLADEDLASLVANNGRANAATRFTQRAHADGVESLYDSLVAIS